MDWRLFMRRLLIGELVRTAAKQRKIDLVINLLFFFLLLLSSLNLKTPDIIEPNKNSSKQTFLVIWIAIKMAILRRI